MRTSSTSSGFWQESWKKMARLPGSAQKAIKKRALFGRFRSYLEYKCKSAGVKLVIANRFYPSTQRCAVCGNIKKDD
ncbi:zinc ribbon domain-containing protein, partial [Lactobacillus delbrueckii subsp. bulgaricus]